MKGLHLAILAALLSTAGAAHAAQQFTWALDADGFACTDTNLKGAMDGDDLAVTVDSTRRCGSIARLGSLQTIFDAGGGKLAIPPEIQHFYVAKNGPMPAAAWYGPSCTPGQPVANPVQPGAATWLQCGRVAEKSNWPTTGGARVYDCTTASHATLAALMPAGAGMGWNLVHFAGGQQVCDATWGASLASPVGSVQVNGTLGDGSALGQTLSAGSSGAWKDVITLRAGATTLSTTINPANPALGAPVTVPLPKFHVETKDEHSLVRVQAELMSTNRLRSVTLGAAVAPVWSHEFFTHGPWSGSMPLCGHDGWGVLGNVLTLGIGCGVFPSAFLQLGADNNGPLHIGVGLSAFVTRSIAFNAGLLFGTANLTTPWNAGTAWFVGFALDPLLLSEAQTASTPPKENQ